MAETQPSRGPAAVFAVGLAGVALLVWWTQGTSTRDLHEGVQVSAPQPPAGASAAPPRPAPASLAPPDAPWLVARREAAEAALARDPNDLDALNQLTQIGLVDPATAMAFNQRALAVAPDDPDARTLQAALASMVGLHDRALERLDAVLATHPGHPRALTYKGLVSMEAGAYEDAIAALEEVIARTGEDPGLRAALDEARRRMASLNAPTDALVAGTIALDPAVGDVLGSAVYVSVRDPAGGAPVAAVRLPPGPFPLAFAVRPSDVLSMDGRARAVPASFDLTVRLDQDGNAMTKVAGEPTASIRTTAGTGGLVVTLR